MKSNCNIHFEQLNDSRNELQKKQCKVKPTSVLLWFDIFNKSKLLPAGLGGSGSSYRIFSTNSEELSEKNGGLPTNKQVYFPD